MASALLITGGNSGEVVQHLAKALQLLEQHAGRITAVSGLYKTPAWGFEAPDFHNQAVELETRLTPHQLLEAIHEVERAVGRDRTAEAAERLTSGQRYASRPIDIDIILYDEQRVDSPQLTIPHRAMAERRFVLEPLAEIAPQRRHPATGLTVAEMLERLNRNEKGE